ncbi:MAG: hypothetical protein OEZ34_14825, partial [Spirochaetia bacterium]|nr:hypothetical protein [Spirochaetia bacterium]
QRLIYEKVHVHYGKPVSIKKYLETAENPEQFESALSELKSDMHALMLDMIRKVKEEKKIP